MYIGYHNKVSKKYKKYIFIGILSTSMIMLATAYILSNFQKDFLNGTFELSASRTFEGVLIMKPFPILKVELKKGIYKDIMLVNKGKFGFSHEKLNTHKIKDKTSVSVVGHLIYYNGHAVLEVENLEIKKAAKQNHFFNNYINIGEKTIRGEIVDPKCYFGIMKPGYGKIHQSCAIRCISGGIPAVLVSRQNPTREEYYVITFKNKEMSNKDLIPFIGKTVRLNGTFKKGKSWSILEIGTNFNGVVINDHSPSYYKIIQDIPAEGIVCTK